MATSDTYRLSARSQRNDSGDDVVNVWHFRQDTTLVFDTAGEDLVAAWQNYVQTLYLGLLSTAYTLDLLEVRQVTGGSEIYQLVVSEAGTRGTDATVLPAQASCVVNWGTGFAGRRFRGRTFMPPASEGDIIDGKYESTYLAGVANFCDAMIDDMASIDIAYAVWTLVVYSTAGGIVSTQITTGAGNPNPGMHRSRRLGVGS